LQRFERRLEGLVEGAFAKAFKGEVHPAEIADKLEREADDHKAIIGHDRVLVPNDFVVELSAHDHGRLSPYADALGEELSAMVREHADRHGYTFVGPVRVHFERHTDLDTGVFRLRSDIVRGASYDPGSRSPVAEPPAAAPPAPAQPAPAAPVPPPPAAPPAQPAQATPDEPPAPSPPAPTEVRAPAPAPRPRYRLAFIAGSQSGGDAGSRYPLTESLTVIGRSPECDLRITDPSISRRHAEIRQDGDGVRISDLGSTNGTSVNGRPVRERRIEPGDRVELGTTRLVFERDES
jgi:cell division septation protein DedD